MTKSELFKAAHVITKKVIQAGDDYRVTFALCLAVLNSGARFEGRQSSTFESNKEVQEIPADSTAKVGDCFVRFVPVAEKRGVRSGKIKVVLSRKITGFGKAFKKDGVEVKYAYFYN